MPISNLFNQHLHRYFVVVTTVFCALLLLARPAHAQWRLDNDASELRFVTTKNTNAAEVQRFTKLTGELSESGAARLMIDLASVETLVPIRNERLQTMLFEIAQFPAAQFDAQVDAKKLAALEPGASFDVELDGKLTLHGKTQDTKAQLRVVRLRDQRIMVTTRAPILVSAAQFDLGAGIEKLREIMALPNIIGTVPVTFALTFQK
jgi:polyisoprenoid-binding protein YceI